ncbi:hypothetical protein [Clostridium beijerinckii]|uniref:Uncharacterized protein n=1 Tax=Clostridium beijerinckii TaxID=1520 RepID=A0AAX0BA58_CLOBE|nr:hypothetical protein [Clostridium beijerinckii]MBA8933721.1 hypothetical protein [Clostridium beijerinckii]NRT92125.1 hypothetical protein [Clostridium beijerinckii]NYC71653.1 hypothetical protein [Clostridium beijerinckii]CUU49520.1 protein of unknown function [Clostridium beijerinckii]
MYTPFNSVSKTIQENKENKVYISINKQFDISKLNSDFFEEYGIDRYQIIEEDNNGIL